MHISFLYFFLSVVFTLYLFSLLSLLINFYFNITIFSYIIIFTQLSIESFSQLNLGQFAIYSLI